MKLNLDLKKTIVLNPLFKIDLKSSLKMSATKGFLKFSSRNSRLRYHDFFQQVEQEVNSIIENIVSFYIISKGISETKLASIDKDQLVVSLNHKLTDHLQSAYGLSLDHTEMEMEVIRTNH